MPRARTYENSIDLPDPATRRALRDTAGIPAYKLATRIGVAPSSIHAWERGDREPTGLQRQAYRKALLRLAENFPSKEGSKWLNDS